MKKAVIYARHSKCCVAEENLAKQIDLCKLYAKKNGYEVVSVYSDIALATEQRPGFDKLLKDASTADWEYVIVKACNRLTVTKDQMINGIAPLRENDIRVVDVMEKCIYDLTEVKSFYESNPIFRIGGTK